MEVLFPELNYMAINRRIQRYIFAGMKFLKLNKDIVPSRSGEIHLIAMFERLIDWLFFFLV